MTAGRPDAGATGAAKPQLLTPFLLICFLNEIEEQCRFVVHAGREIAAQWAAFVAEMQTDAEPWVPYPHPPPDLDIGLVHKWYRDEFDRRRASRRTRETQPEVIWYHIQNLVISAAMISKLLWGDETSETLHQRQDLRGLLRVRPNSPLRKRSVRNLSEHIDEDLIKQFTGSGAARGIAQRNIGPAGSVSIGRGRYYLGFDPGASRLTTGGRVISVSAVVAEAARILDLVESASAKATDQLIGR